MNKVKTIVSLKKTISELKKQGKKIVFTNGCFDLIHPGHIKILKEAKKKGDILVVGVNSDCSVKKIKGEIRPILDEKMRLIVLNALEDIDYITVFKEPTPYKLIKSLKPDYLVKGADWKEKNIVGKDLVDKVFRVKLLKNHSTTAIIKTILKKAKSEFQKSS